MYVTLQNGLITMYAEKELIPKKIPCFEATIPPKPEGSYTLRCDFDGRLIWWESSPNIPPVVSPPSPPTNEELEKENKLLKAQIEALSTRNDFMEDCLVELAGQVY